MDEYKVKNLEMIQGIISRMANNSFMLKGWSVTLDIGIFSLNYKTIEKGFFVLLYIVIIIFWGLDSYYLKLERQYRCVYKMCLNDEIDRFDLNIKRENVEKKVRFYQCLFSPTELIYYFSLALTLTIVLIIK